jgi:hypothetical protein
MNNPVHLLHWQFGWWLILSAFITGAMIGRFFPREEFFVGCASFQRRLLRLRHNTQAMLGMMSFHYAYSPWPNGWEERWSRW